MPDLVVERVDRLYNDGLHNAFTDLCRFRGRLFLAFRSCPEGHMLYTSSRIVVFVSEDAGDSWREVARFGVLGRDVRDPHLLVFCDRLHVYTGTWLVGENDQTRDMNDMLGYALWSNDGETWHGPEPLAGTEGHYVWRAASYDDVAYLCARRQRGGASPPDGEETWALTEAAMLRSDDGLRWETVGLFAETYGDETAFLFEPDGAVVAVHRGMLRQAGQPSLVCRSRPPYKTWERRSLGIDIGGPLLARFGGRYLVGGRAYDGPDDAPRTALWWLEGDRLQEITRLPSGGDNSYPGFVELAPNRALLSYYSSHEGSGTHRAPSAIYLARLRLT